MPSGRTHDRITLWSLPWVGGLSYLLTRSGELTLIVAGSFLFSGLMFGPDLDIYSRQYQRWGVLRWLWLPYRSLLNHRSLLSHGLLVGTGLRLIYLLTVLTPIALLGVAIARFLWGLEWDWWQWAVRARQLVFGEYLPEAIALLVGLELGAISHAGSDWLVSAYKKKKRKKRRSSPHKRRP